MIEVVLSEERLRHTGLMAAQAIVVKRGAAPLLSLGLVQAMAQIEGVETNGELIATIAALLEMMERLDDADVTPEMRRSLGQFWINEAARAEAANG